MRRVGRPTLYWTASPGCPRRSAFERRGMKIGDIPVQTSERYELISITDEMKRVVQEAGVDEGLCIVASTHTTAAVTGTAGDDVGGGGGAPWGGGGRGALHGRLYSHDCGRDGQRGLRQRRAQGPSRGLP